MTILEFLDKGPWRIFGAFIVLVVLAEAIGAIVARARRPRCRDCSRRVR